MVELELSITKHGLTEEGTRNRVMWRNFVVDEANPLDSGNPWMNERINGMEGLKNKSAQKCNSYFTGKTPSS
jgi:hypothetical protein